MASHMRQNSNADKEFSSDAANERLRINIPSFDDIDNELGIQTNIKAQEVSSDNALPSNEEMLTTLSRLDERAVATWVDGSTDMRDTGQVSSEEWHRRHGKHRNSKQMREKRKTAKKRHPLRVFVVVLILLAVLCGFVYLLFGSAQKVRADVSTTMMELKQLNQALREGDSSSLSSHAQNVAQLTEQMKGEVADPLWDIAAKLPVVNRDVDNARVLVNILDDVADKALVPYASNEALLSLKNVFTEGRINVDALESIVGVLGEVEPVLTRSKEALDGLEPGMIEQVNNALSSAQDTVGPLASLAQNADTIASVLPSVFAKGGTRTYLVMAMNNAELRCIGGYPGSTGTLTFVDGEVQMGDFVSAGTYMRAASNKGFHATISDEEHAAFTGGPAEYATGVTFIPDFPRAADLAAQYWEAGFDTYVDGVLGVDPVFLQRLLALTDGIVTSDGISVTGENAAQALMSDVYWRYEGEENANAQEDAWFVEVADLSLHKLLDNLGSVDLIDLMGAISSSGADGHLKLWLRDEAEQQGMVTLGIDGGIGYDPTKPIAGVYTYDNTTSKIDWYIKRDVEVGKPVVNTDGSSTYDVTVTMTNTLTEEVAQSAPRYVTGTRGGKWSKGDMMTCMFFFGPAGGTLSKVSCSFDEIDRGARVGRALNNDFTGTVYGHDFWYRAVHIDTGQSVSFSFKVTTSTEAASPLEIRVTPLCREID